MVKSKEARTPFQLRDVRRTCETMLAELGVSRDVRAQLLSHGISGVQAQHYDRYAYMTEKSAALASWEGHLKSIAGRINARARRRQETRARESARIELASLSIFTSGIGATRLSRLDPLIDIGCRPRDQPA